MQVWSVLHTACWKYRTQKIAIWAQSHNFGASTLYISGLCIGSVTARHSSVSQAFRMVQGTLELRNFCRVRHRYLAWRPSRWASAYILVAWKQVSLPDYSAEITNCKGELYKNRAKDIITTICICIRIGIECKMVFMAATLVGYIGGRCGLFMER